VHLDGVRLEIIDQGSGKVITKWKAPEAILEHILWGRCIIGKLRYVNFDELRQWWYHVLNVGVLYLSPRGLGSSFWGERGGKGDSEFRFSILNQAERVIVEECSVIERLRALLHSQRELRSLMQSLILLLQYSSMCFALVLRLSPRDSHLASGVGTLHQLKAIFVAILWNNRLYRAGVYWWPSCLS
jgi:hypothetical protein